MLTHEDFKDIVRNLQLFQYKVAFNNIDLAIADKARKNLAKATDTASIISTQTNPITQHMVDLYSLENDVALFQLRRFIKKHLIEDTIKKNTDKKLNYDLINKLVILGQQLLIKEMTPSELEAFYKSAAEFIIQDIYQEMIIPKWIIGDDEKTSQFYRLHREYLVKEGMTYEAAHIVILGKIWETDKKVVLKTIEDPINPKEMAQIEDILYRNSLKAQIT